VVSIILFTIGLCLFLAFWFWHSPIRWKLSREEIDRYLRAAEKLPLPPGEMTADLARLRAWAEADDGKPVYMLNLMRFYLQLCSFSGAPDCQGKPEQANGSLGSAAGAVTAVASNAASTVANAGDAAVTAVEGAGGDVFDRLKSAAIDFFKSWGK